MTAEGDVQLANQAQGTAPAADRRARPLADRKILIIVENLPAPFDRRVWQEARALTEAGAQVCIICPRAKGFEAAHEKLEGVHIYRHPMPAEGAGPIGYLKEYAAALFWEMVLAWRIFVRHGFDVIHACNPPDLIFLVALPFKLLGRRFLFDHHDINPELFEAKFGRKGAFWRLLVLAERLTFACADISIATNESYRRIAIERGRMRLGETCSSSAAGPISRAWDRSPRSTPGATGGSTWSGMSG